MVNRAWAFGVLLQRSAAVRAAAFPLRGDCRVHRLQLALPALAAAARLPANRTFTLVTVIVSRVVIGFVTVSVIPDIHT